MIASPPQALNRVPDDIPAIVFRVDARKSDFWAKHEDVFPKGSLSAFWTRYHRFNQLTEETHKAKAFEKGWDGYNASAPNDESVIRTLYVLSKVRESKLTPYSVLPSADGGIGISFRGNDNKRAVLELLNDGTSSYVFYGKGCPTESSEFDSNTELPRIVQLLEEYL
jgi:hypothetical protein